MRVVRAAEHYGWLLALAAALLAVVLVYTKAPQQISSDIPVPGETKAFEPGTGFNVASYCKSAKTVTVVITPGAEVIGTRRVARNSDLDYIEWLDNNTNTSATRYYVDKQGKPQHETVDVEGAVTCMRQQR